MPRPTTQTPFRHLLLQITLLSTLICTLALARLVTRYKLRQLLVTLTNPVSFGDLKVRLPQNWTVQPSRATPSAPLILRVNEPPTPAGLPGRILTLVRDHQDLPLPPLEYLLNTQLLPTAYVAQLAGTARLQLSTLPVANHPGLLAAGLRAIRTPTGQLLPVREYFATATLPSRDVLSLCLESLSPDPDEDLELLRNVAAGLSLPTPATLTPTDTLTLPTGTSVRIPPGFLPYPEPDPHFTERHLVHAALPAHWTRLTLVPCLFFPDDTDETFRSMLTARDPEWLTAKISRVPLPPPPTPYSELHTRNSRRPGNREPATRNSPPPTTSNFIADLPTHNGLPFPHRAYLLTSPSGNALLIELLANSPQDAADAASTLQSLAQSATLPAGPTPALVLESSKEVLSSLSSEGLPSLLRAQRTDQYWLFLDHNAPVGYSHLRLSPLGDPAQGSLDTHVLTGRATSADVHFTFETSPDFSRHNDRTLRQDTYPGSPQPLDGFKQQTSTTPTTFSTLLLPDPAAAQGIRSAIPMPPAFLPGPWLTALLPHLPKQQVIFRTTHLPGLETHAATAPIPVRLTPTTRPAEFTLDLSGTGQLFTLSPTTYTLSETQSHRPTTPDELQRLHLLPRPRPAP